MEFKSRQWHGILLFTKNFYTASYLTGTRSHISGGKAAEA
jgi:hypothetical protein